MVRAVGDKQTGTIVPDFDRSINIDFQGAKITCDTGFLLMMEIDQRFNILSAAALQETISPFHTGRYEWRRITPGMENVFVHLMKKSEGKVSP